MVVVSVSVVYVVLVETTVVVYEMSDFTFYGAVTVNCLYLAMHCRKTHLRQLSVGGSHNESDGRCRNRCRNNNRLCWSAVGVNHCWNDDDNICAYRKVSEIAYYLSVTYTEQMRDIPLEDHTCNPSRHTCLRHFLPCCFQQGEHLFRQ